MNLKFDRKDTQIASPLDWENLICVSEECRTGKFFQWTIALLLQQLLVSMNGSQRNRRRKKKNEHQVAIRSQPIGINSVEKYVDE